ncbi:MAG: hypothetical protein HAW66_08550 [Shewanella sp.]|nr:hypothetical protein [Shewanella sp.]
MSVQAFAADDCQTNRQQMIDKDDVQVWATTLCNKSRLEFHTHQTARVLIPEQDGMIKVLYKNGDSQIIKLAKGVPAYLPVSEGLMPHQDINIGSEKLRVMVISIR